MAKEYYVVTIIGPDRRGLVASITKKITSLNANIEESHMTRLGGEFAVLMLLSLTRGNQQTLANSLDKLNKKQEKSHL
jgi:glycine cleavage system transcriptional repressor